MQTKKDLLPAINSLYSLELSEEQIQKLANPLTTFGLGPDDDDEAESFKMFHYLEATDKVVCLIRANDSTVQIHKFPDPDDEHAREMKINEQLCKDNLQNGWIRNVKNDGYGYNSDRLFDSKTVLHGFRKLSKANLKDLTEYRYMTNLLKLLGIKLGTTQIFEDLADANKTMRDLIYTNADKINDRSKADSRADHDDFNKLKNNAKRWWPGMNVTTSPMSQISDKTQEGLTSLSDMKMITFVGEMNNTRMCILEGHQNRRGGGGYWNGSNDSELFILPHTHEAYNYCDVGRVLYKPESSYRQEKLHLGKLLFLDDQAEVPKDEAVFKHYIRQKGIIKEDFELVDNAELRRSLKIFLKREIRKQREENAQERIRQKTKDKLDLLKDETKQLKINDMIFSKNGVEYQGQHLTIKKDCPAATVMEHWVHNLVSNLTRYQNIQDIYFDTMITSFASGIQKIADRGLDVSGTIGDIDFNVRSVTSTNVNNVTSTRWYLNEKRINYKEMGDILERGICFENQPDFDSFVKSVSACSLYFHKYLQRGIDINVRDDFDHTNVTLKFPLERKKGKMYLVLGDREFRVKNTHKIINLHKKYNIMEVVTSLLDGTVVLDVVADDIKDIINDGKSAYVTAVEKSKLLLSETESLFDLTASDHRIGEDNKFGYRIDGKMRSYFLEKNYESEDKNSCGVYDYNTGQYICIVDKSTSQVGMDKLVNRIYALHNDALVAQHINTLTNNGN